MAMTYFVFTDDARYGLTRGRGCPPVPAPFVEKTDCPLSNEWPCHLFESQLACACGSAPKLSVLLHGCVCLSRSHTTESLPGALVVGCRVEGTASSESLFCRMALSYMLAFLGDFRFSPSVSTAACWDFGQDGLMDPLGPLQGQQASCFTWSRVDLQDCVRLQCTAKWWSHVFLSDPLPF